LAVDVLSPPDVLFVLSLLDVEEDDEDEDDDESPDPLDEADSLFVSCPAPFGPRFFEP
jgi:hypothetical protein